MTGTCITTTGMCGLWDPTHFPMVYDLEGWQDTVGNEANLVRQVAGGYFVPVKLNTPGVFFYEVREGGGLTDREQSLLAASSRQYLFRSSGTLCFGDYQHLEAVASEKVGTMPLGAGEYLAQAHILSWDKEPGATNERGWRNDGYLPDLLVILNPAPPGFMGPSSLQSFV